MNVSLSYREGSVRGASPIQLVVLLYEQAIEDLRRALAAQRRGDIETRTREINHAILVISYLQATLDREQGGEVATNLDRFYNQVRQGLADAQFQQSPALLEQHIALLMQVHGAWAEVERLQAAPAPTAPESPNSRAETSSEWNG